MRRPRARALPLAIWPFAFSLACSAEPSSASPPSSSSSPSATSAARAPTLVAASTREAKETAPDAADPSSKCAACHSTIAQEWESSQHHHSASDPSYVAAVAREPAPFCRKCHAPSSAPLLPTPAAERERGIGCMDCHVGLRPEHASTHRAPPAAARACSGCHEFSFQSAPTLMQKTAAEHAHSAFSATPCTGCHMSSLSEGARAHRDHRFAISAEMLSRALVADVAPAGPGRVAFRLAAGEIGHAFPTGDLFRRLAVTIVSLDDEGRPIARAVRHLSRHFATVPRGNGTFTRRDARDDRVGASLEPCFELDVGTRGRDRPLRIEIAYERVDEPTSSREDDAIVSLHAPVWQGTLPAFVPETSRPCR